MGLTAGAIAGIVSATAAVASAGVGIAAATGAFDPDQPDIPTRGDPAVEEARQRQLRAARNAKGVGSTILTPLTQEAEPQTQSATLLGQAAPRTG